MASNVGFYEQIYGDYIYSVFHKVISMIMYNNKVGIFLNYWIHSILDTLNDIIIFIPYVFNRQVVMNIYNNHVGIFWNFILCRLFQHVWDKFHSRASFHMIVISLGWIIDHSIYTTKIYICTLMNYDFYQWF